MPKIKKMSLKKNIIALFLLIFVISSCKTIDRKIDNLSLEEEKNLNRLLGKQQIELINEFGKPDGVIHNDDGGKDCDEPEDKLPGKYRSVLSCTTEDINKTPFVCQRDSLAIVS